MTNESETAQSGLMGDPNPPQETAQSGEAANFAPSLEPMEADLKPLVADEKYLKKLSLKSINEIVKENEMHFNKRMDEFEKQLMAVTNHVDKIHSLPTEPPSATPRVATAQEKTDIIKSVEAVLGEGFVVSTESAGDGVSFKLTIVPPEHLREDANDKRIKMIPYLEGSAGAVAYAEQVKAFCMKWAHKTGTTFVN